MTKDALNKVLARHAAWLRGDGGERAVLTAAYLRDADLRGADLRDASLTGADLRGATLIGAYLTGADLRDAYLRDAILTDATLIGADLRDATLIGADLAGAVLTEANLTEANLTGANLTGANLQYADLTGAVLTDADLFDASLTGADLTGAILGNPPGLRTAKASDISGRNMQLFESKEDIGWLLETHGGGHYVPPRRSGRGHDPQALPLDEIELWVNNDEGLYAWWKSTRLSMRKFISENRDDLRGAIREVLNCEPSRNPGRTLQVGTRVEVSAGSGTNSGRRGTVVPRSRIKTCGRGIPLLPGHYKPMSKDEVVVELDDGSLITMYKNRLGAL
jgi:uncharacterized protein YjbI with pentapeptide repeats